LVRKISTILGKAMTASQCIHYALTRPAVTSVLLGCKSETELVNSLHYLRASETERDYSHAIKDFKGTSQKTPMVGIFWKFTFITGNYQI
jgi:predicted aldo/keto reductase-like oxidoreductase